MSSTYSDLITKVNDVYEKEIDYRSDKLLNISKQIYQLEINDVREFSTNHFIIYKHHVTLTNGKNRSYLVKIPKDIDVSNYKKCVMFFHGSKDLHWDVALLSTTMITNDFITIYLQGNNQGTFELTEPHLHHYGYISYGENYFEIRDFAPNFSEDIEYVKLAKLNIIDQYSFTDFYAVGHSNGGVFVCLFPIYLPNEFIAIVSHQGGIGWDEWFNIPFEKLDENIKKPAIHFYTGTEDIHLVPCIQANQLFTNEGFDSSIYIEHGLKHTWKKYHEVDILNYFRKYQKN